MANEDVTWKIIKREIEQTEAQLKELERRLASARDALKEREEEKRENEDIIRLKSVD